MENRKLEGSQVQARFDEVLDALDRHGPVDVMKNGKKVATLVPYRDPSSHGKNLDLLAPLFAQGAITSRQAMDESGASFEALLAEMALQGLKLPEHSAPKSPAQQALLDDALSRGLHKSRSSSQTQAR